MKPLYIREKDKSKGLFIFCLKCKKNINNKKCGLKGTHIRACDFTPKHCFRAIIIVPESNGVKRKTKVFKTRDIEEATRLKLEFEKQLKENKYHNTSSPIPKENMKPFLLKKCMELYLNYLNNIGVPEYKIKIRTIEHIKDVKRSFNFLLEALKNGGFDIDLFKINEINETTASLLHNFLLYKKNYSNKTYNNNIALVRHFISWLIEKKDYKIKNPFKEVVRRKVSADNLIITQKEFNLLLAQINHPNGLVKFPSGTRNYYRDWLKHAFILALETGLRREEFVKIKYKDISFNENKQPVYIKVENYKVNRILGENSEGKRWKYVPITKNLLILLKELKYKEKLNTDLYLIGENESLGRKSMMLFTSKAFSHYWGLTKVNKELKLKHLRKTYLTSLVAKYGEKASFISNHSDISVLKNHYVNHSQIASATVDFSVFDNEENEPEN